MDHPSLVAQNQDIMEDEHFKSRECFEDLLMGILNVPGFQSPQNGCACRLSGMVLHGSWGLGDFRQECGCSIIDG